MSLATLPVKLPNVVLLSRTFLKKIPQNSFSIIGNRSWKVDDGKGRKSYSQERDEYIVSSPLGETKIPDILFHELMFSNWSFWEWRTAVVCGHTGRKYTFRNLRNNSRSLAAALQNKLNISKGDVLGVILPNCPEYPIIVLAASQIGAVLTTINPILTSYEIRKQVESLDLKALFAWTYSYDKCVSLAKEMNLSIPIFVLKAEKGDEIPSGAISLIECFNDSSVDSLKPVDVKPTDNFLLPFSSGTSGAPKGVILTHKNLVANLTQLSHPETTINLSPTWFHQTSVLGVIPMCHIFGMMVVTFFSLKEGCRLIVLPQFNPRELVQTLHWKKVSIIYAVPALIKFLTHEAIRPRYLKHLKFVVNGSASYSTKDVNLILKKSENIKIAQGYGMTETSPVLTHTSSRRMQKLSSVGIPISSTKLKVVDIETKKTLPAKKHGELCAFGPQVMKGYLNRPEETKNAFDQYGWLKTGDLGYYDEDGDFFILERLKEMIKVSGFQVSPTELEETLKIHPKIKEAVVVGIPHERYGEVPRAFIILQKKGDMTEEEIHTFISKKLVEYKHLKGGVVFVDDYPKSSVGKILREELKKLR